jgi:hypothetical protein
MRIPRLVLMMAPLLLTPGVARAAEVADVPAELSIGTGLAMLVAAAVLLIIALALARVAEGSAVAQNISFVVAACACLGASVLAAWAVRMAPDSFSASQARLGSDLLIIAAIAFFSVYFWRVRASLKSFLAVIAGDDLLARAQGAPEASSTVDGPVTGGPDA